MLFDRIFTQNSILESAMQGHLIRNEVITNNIANADVPGFKKSVVSFEDELANALGSAKKKTSPRLRSFVEFADLDLSSIAARTFKVKTNNFYRLDGNNVDVQKEMVDLYTNSIKYDTLASSVMNNYRRINLVTSLK